jgi:hypothetical protein
METTDAEERNKPQRAGKVGQLIRRRSIKSEGTLVIKAGACTKSSTLSSIYKHNKKSLFGYCITDSHIPTS